jgi:hypothetical protein
MQELTRSTEGLTVRSMVVAIAGDDGDRRRRRGLGEDAPEIFGSIPRAS